MKNFGDGYLEISCVFVIYGIYNDKIVYICMEIVLVSERLRLLDGLCFFNIDVYVFDSDV